MDSIKNITFITKSRFWSDGSGFWARTREMIRFLQQHYNVQVFYLNGISQDDIQKLKQQNLKIKLAWHGGVQKEEQKFEWIQQLQHTLISFAQEDFYIIDKTELSEILDYLPRDAPRILDTHDIISERSKKLQEYKQQRDPFELSKDEEIAIFNRYQGIICIQQDEYNLVSEWLDDDKVILAQHPVTPFPQRFQPGSKKVGFVASDWHANISGLNRFLEEVWPNLISHGIELHVYGSVCSHFKNNKNPNVFWHGFKQELKDCYQEIDIAINPVYYGAGLKIKSIEALSFGIPIVATSEGASGLTQLDGEAILIAKNKEDFINKILLLLNDSDKRLSMRECGLDLINNKFSHEACFKSLKEFIDRYPN